MRESIQNLLRDLRGLDQLKRLFWQELNYDRVNVPVPTRGWSDEERALLDGAPLLLAEHGDFKIITIRMRDGLNRTAERGLINKLLQSYLYALFVFSDSTQERWHFVNVKDEPSARRQVFRRISVEAGSDRLRTALERLSMLDLIRIDPSLENISVLSIQKLHDEAFDVETVTKSAIRNLHLWYHDQRNGFLMRRMSTMPKRERREYSTEYPTDLSDAQWAVIEPLVVTTSPKGGRPTEIDLRAIVNALLYKNRTGCQWRLLPADLPPMGAIRYYFDKWNRDGTFVKLNDTLRKAARKALERDEEPSISILDSQSTKTTEVGGERGIDGAKKNKRTQTPVLG